MALMSGGNRLVIGSTAVTAFNRFEAHKLPLEKASNNRSILVTADFSAMPFVDISKLKAAAEAYDLPPDIRDYVLTEIPANNVGIPNRNMDAFHMRDITEFRPMLGRIAYETYILKGCYLQHDNQDPLKAKGIIFDSRLAKFKNKFHCFVVCGWSRTKDPVLAKEILKDPNVGFSMACLVATARCSVCGFVSYGGNVTCEHIKNGAGKGTLWPVEGGPPKLAFEWCGQLNFHEISRVSDRACQDCVKHWVHP